MKHAPAVGPGGFTLSELVTLGLRFKSQKKVLQPCTVYIYIKKKKSFVCFYYFNYCYKKLAFFFNMFLLFFFFFFPPPPSPFYFLSFLAKGLTRF